MRLPEMGRRENAEPDVFETPSDLQRAVTGHERLVQLAKQQVDVREDSADLAAALVVVQPLGESLGLAQALQRPWEFTEQGQHGSQFEPSLKAFLQRGLALRECVENA